MSIAISMEKINNPPSYRIFVFGSNLAGRHGKGAALHAARYYGAQPDISIGLAGQCYAIPTKDQMLRPLRLEQVQHFVGRFVAYANSNPQLHFNVIRVGCGYAGFRDDQIAPLFARASDNCWFDIQWKPWLPNKKFWEKRP